MVRSSSGLLSALALLGSAACLRTNPKSWEKDGRQLGSFALPSGASDKLEVVIENVRTEVQQQFASVVGSDPWLIEVFVSKETPMEALMDAEFMRAVFTPSAGHTAPSVEARVDLTASPPSVEYLSHEGPFLGNGVHGGFPPQNGMTFAAAWNMMQLSRPGTQPRQVVFRKPVHPCVSEDLYIFSGGFIASVGVNSSNVCDGTMTIELPHFAWCGTPQCFNAE